jgi:methylenetetrahydrofolate dehydrogenase (NADP+)/methenyltetrahydrofolate cyclohydrolase
MSAKIIDGKQIGQEIRDEVKLAVDDRLKRGLSAPGLATVLVGENPASQVYVRNKQKACAEAGINSFGHHLPEDATQEEVEALFVNSTLTLQSMAFSCNYPFPATWMKKKCSVPSI